MTDDQAKETVTNLLRVLYRQEQLVVVKEMTRRELSQGVLFAGRLHDLVEDVNQWLRDVSERVLQDQANAET
jgi:hypothetical protein